MLLACGASRVVAADELSVAAVERFRGCLDHVRAVADRGPMFTAGPDITLPPCARPL